MQEADFVFQVTTYDKQALLPQVSKALEKRTELVSRQACPGVWKLTDRLRASSEGRRRSPLRTKIGGVVCLVLGVVLLVPGIMEPDKLFVPLIAGAIAVAVGIARLWPGRRNSSPFDASADKLLSGLQALPEKQQLSLSFSAQGMTAVAGEEKSETVPWNRFECAVETSDILLLVYGEQVMLLQKKDLVQGTETELYAFLASHMENCHLI